MVGAWGIVPSTVAFALLTAVVLCAHLLYAEALVRNRKHARLAGQAKYWIGNKTAAFGGALIALQIFGSNLAYVILGGEFVAVLAKIIGFDIPLIVWQVLFWVSGGLLVLFGLRLVSRVGSYLTWLLVAVIVFLVGIFTLDIDLRMVFEIPLRCTFEPYGVFLFSLLGITALPETVEVVNYRREDVRKAVIRGTLTAAVLTYGFGVSAWLASSGMLGRNPADIVLFLPPFLAFLIPLFGFLAVMTSFIASALDLRNMFHRDYRLPRWLAWVSALGVPLVLLFLTSRDFLATIGLVGSVFGAAVAILVSFLGRAALRKERGIRKFSTLWVWREVVPVAVTIFFVIGGIAWVFAG
jgi:amino acid permease